MSKQKSKNKKISHKRKLQLRSIQPDGNNLKRQLNKNPRDDNTRYQLAQYYLESKQAEKALEIALPLVQNIPKDNKSKQAIVFRFIAFAALYANRLDEADAYSKKGIDLAPDNLDFYFVAAITSARQSNFESAKGYAEKYLNIRGNMANAEELANPLDLSYNMKYQLLSGYGAVLNELNEREKAEDILFEAIEENPEFEPSYVNLAVLYKSQSKFTEVFEIIKQGLRAIPESAKLRKMIDWSDKRTTISACMIVKDEEEFLPRCLRSIKDVVDEIILVDTGSTDRTIEIAKEFGCKIYHYPWKGDFSSARNESMKYATKEWIFIIDADEEFPPEGIPQLRLVTSQDEFDIVSISVINKSLETGQVTSFLPSVRLVKRRLDLKYYGIVHNRLDIPADLLALRSEIQLYHYGYDIARDKLDKKLERSRKLLEKQLKKNPNDVYANFNMAQLLRGYKNSSSEEISKQIVEHANRVINNPDSKLPVYFGQRIMARYQKAIGLCSLRKYEEAEECCLEALEEKPDYLDPILTLGDIYNYLTKFDKAKEYYHLYLDSQKEYDAGDEKDNIILHNLEARHKAWFGLGLAGEREDNPEEAIEAYQHVLKNKDPYLDASLRLGKLYLDNEYYSEAEEIFRKEIAGDDTEALAFHGLGCVLALKNQEDEAITYLEKAIQLNPDLAECRLMLGQLQSKSGNFDKGIENIITAAESNPSNPKINFEAGNSLFELGNFEKSIECYTKTLAVTPDDIEVLNNLGNCFFKMKQYHRAEEIYRQLLKINPDYWPAYRNLGLSYSYNQNPEKAIEALMQYSKNTPEDTSIYNVMGCCMSDMGLHREAIACFEKYLLSYPQDYICIFNMADAYYRLGAFEAARMGYRQVLNIAPEYAIARERLNNLESPVATN
ncbi:MAG: tetratricopeptide repeat protein [candidate division Zixibacteria bacterium]